MADTRQSVQWTLVQRCRVRPEAEVSNLLLHRAQNYRHQQSQAHCASFNLSGICVTSTSGLGIPLDGFFVEDEFAAVGGSAGLCALCSACPANAALEGVAGCVGWFSLEPYGQDLDEQLRQLIVELDLGKAFDRVFPSTELLWFALWMNSPLSPDAMQVLMPLLDALGEEHRASDLNRIQPPPSPFEQFVRAMERALYFGLELRVEMTPPGHTDFGWWTTFPHCPRCKAGLSSVAQWGKVPHDWLTCAICGHEFDPATTASKKRTSLDSEDTDLLQKLGEERFREFAVGYIVARGRTLEAATAAVNKHLAPPDAATLERRRQSELKQREKRRFISTVLCAGFERLRAEAPEDVEERVSFHYLFSASEVALLLERVRHWGAEVVSISYYMQTEEAGEDDLDDGECVLCGNFETPGAALQDLLSRGGAELFSVVAGVSDAVVEAWNTSQQSRGHHAFHSLFCRRNCSTCVGFILQL